ncbi:hypothetical protein JB92DRAFT_3128318 [Gautieria morchelliformis]|nr:hypothetical protein JB92DRAFT_3128318 [Gautieria morchelliformis]
MDALSESKPSAMPMEDTSKRALLDPHHHLNLLSHGLKARLNPSDSCVGPRQLSPFSSRTLAATSIHTLTHASQSQPSWHPAIAGDGNPSAQPGHPPKQNHSLATPIPDPGDPVAILNTKGINEGTKADISALATALESFGDFKRGTTWNLGKEGATQLIAITKLLREASQGGLRHQTSCNRWPWAILPGLNGTSYAAAAKRGMGGTSNPAALQKQKMTAELQQKHIFLSMKNVAKDSHILKWEPAVATRYCSGIIANYFERHPEASPPMPLSLRGITKSTAGNITLTFKTVKDANKARAHADKWVKEIDPAATSPQRSYAWWRTTPHQLLVQNRGSEKRH